MLAGIVTAALAVGLGVGLAGRDDEAAGPTPAAATVNAAAVPRAGAVQLAGTRWQLVQVSADGRSVPARPNLDHVLELASDGGYLFTSCNNVFGDALVGTDTLHTDGGSNTSRECPGPAAFIDAAIHRVVPGALTWRLSGRVLTLRSAAEGVELQLRVKDRIRPPTTAAEIVTVERGGVSCRAVVGGTGEAERLYVLTRTRSGGPWRLLESGPAAPGEGPIRSPARPKPDEPTCVIGFAPPGAVAVTYRRSATGPASDLPLREVPGSDRRIYAALIVAVPEGAVEARDGAGRLLARWAVLN